MKKRNPSDGQNGQMVQWWVLVHSGPTLPVLHIGGPGNPLLVPFLLDSFASPGSLWSPHSQISTFVGMGIH